MANHRVSIADGEIDNVAQVTREGSLKVTISPTLGVEENITAVPFTKFLSVNNDGVTTNLSQNGSLATPVDAFVSGVQTGDFYITTLNVLVADAGSIQLNRFGADAALINGVEFYYSIPAAEIVLGTAHTNFDMIRFGTLSKPTGGKTDAFQLANTNPANEDGYNPIIDLERTSTGTTGIRLRQNSRDKLGVRIRDNLTGISTFNILAIGFIRLINEEGE